MAWHWLTRIVPCCGRIDDVSDGSRASTPLFGTSRPSSYFSEMDRLPSRQPNPTQPPGLRPLRLVEMQQARRGMVPARGSSLRRESLLRPLPAPPMLPPPTAPAWPSAEELDRLDSWRSVDTLWAAPDDVDEPPAEAPKPRAPTVPATSRQSVHYDVNDRLHRARAARALSPLNGPPLQRAQTAPPQLIAAHGSELPYLRPPSPAPSLPVRPRLAARRAPTHAEQHEMAIEALRAQGSWLPDLIQQARRGHVLTIPPHVQARGQARTAALGLALAGTQGPGTAPATHPRGR